MALLAPMPSASSATAIAANSGRRMVARSAARHSWSIAGILRELDGKRHRSVGSAVQSAIAVSPSALRRQVGQLLIAGFNGHQLPVELKRLAREFGLGGVILFARNVADPEQVAELCYDAARLDPELPLWVSVDQEGGRVARLKAPFTEWPPMATLGRSGDVHLAVECGPFGAAMAAQVSAIMTGHVFLPALDDKRPATLSKRIVTDLLRDELGYQGLILSDDLEMKAIASEYAASQSAVLAVEAGCDGMLICSGDHDAQASALEAIVHAVEDDRVRSARVEEALARQRRTKERFLTAPVVSRPRTRQALPELLGRDDHRAIAAEMARFA